MIKIKYPLDPSERKNFESKYLEFLEIKEPREKAINLLLKELTVHGKPLTIKALLITPFDDLQSLHNQLSQLDEQIKKKLMSFLNYSNAQPKIADFFMQQSWINLDSCYYCNLDHIYSFTDRMEYSSPLDFLNRADHAELQLVERLGPDKADSIIKKRNTSVFTNLDSLPAGVGKKVKENIKNFEFRKTHNHFTLDHFYHQDAYKMLSICLYNFVPCCYSCNTKFKKTLEISDQNGSKFVSPSSDSYGMEKQFAFKLQLQKPLDDISGPEHFLLVYGTEDNDDLYHSFLKTFKILGRYIYHKKEVLRLIKKKLEYPQTRIDEIVSMSGMSEKEVKKILFGAELFEEEFNQKPLVKFKRDIARDIFIEGVIK